MIHRRVRAFALVCASLSLAACGTGSRAHPTATWHAPGAGGTGGGGPVAAAAGSDADAGKSAAGQRIGRRPPPGQPSPSSPAPDPADPSASPPDPSDPSASPAGPSPSAADGLMRRTGSDRVALTFDDGPSQYTPQILALLRSYGIKATFCLIGVNVRANPGLVQQIVADGHTLCNHSWRHDLKLGSRSPDAIRKDLQMTSDEIHRAVPDAPIKYYRQPGGMWTPGIVSVARELGMTPLHWSVDPLDWNTQRWAVGAPMTNHIVANVEHNTGPGSIVLSHDGGGKRDSTIAAYRTLLPYLKDRFQLVALPV